MDQKDITVRTIVDSFPIHKSYPVNNSGGYTLLFFVKEAPWREDERESEGERGGRGTEGDGVQE